MKQEVEENKLRAEQEREELAQRISENLKEIEAEAEEDKESGEDNAVNAASEEAMRIAEKISVSKVESIKTVPVVYTKEGEVKEVDIKFEEFTVSA